MKMIKKIHLKNIIRILIIHAIIIMIIVLILSGYYFINKIKQKEHSLELITSVHNVSSVENNATITIPNDFIELAYQKSDHLISKDNIVNYILFAESEVHSNEQVSEAYEILSQIIRTVKDHNFSDKSIREVFSMVNNIIVHDFNLHYTNNGTTLTADLINGTSDCDTRSFIHAAVAYEMNWPIYIVYMPDHAFVRWDDGTLKINFETTTNKIISTSELLDEFEYDLDISKLNLNRYLLNASYDEIIGATYLNIAIPSFNDGQYDKNYKFIQKAQLYHPNFPTVLKMSSIYYSIHINDYENSIQIANKLINVNNTANSYLILSNVYSSFQMYREAFDANLLALLLDPDNSKVLTSIGWNAYHLGDLDLAIEFSEKSKQQNDSEYPIFVNLGLFYLLKGNIEKSEKYYLKAYNLGNHEEISKFILIDLEESLNMPDYNSSSVEIKKLIMKTNGS